MLRRLAQCPNAFGVVLAYDHDFDVGKMPARCCVWLLVRPSGSFRYHQYPIGSTLLVDGQCFRAVITFSDKVEGHGPPFRSSAAWPRGRLRLAI